MLSPGELQRYARQVRLPGIGIEGQTKLRAARVLIVGAGGLGSPVAMYLAAAGVGTLGLVDFDVVDASNLHRQLVHGTGDIGRPKVESARDRLADINPHVTVEVIAEALTSANALAVVGRFDMVVDASDNFATRYLVNDAGVLSGVPVVYGSVERFEGQASVFGVPGSACYRCLFREPPPPGLVPTCAEAGVFGVLPGLVGMIQATEVIKYLTGVGETLVGRLLLVDAGRMQFRSIAVRPDPECPVCGTREQTGLIDYEAFCGLRPAPARAGGIPQLTVRALAQRLAAGDAPLLLDVREPWEYEVARVEGAQLLPLGQVMTAPPALPRDRDIVLLCHHGMRSLQAAQALRLAGYERLFNLTGGIDAWSVEVDPAVARY
jgi:molybdopterin/thiamine biosynthesis adenylyltransferase/rhodanese-related sulfurtransferase